MKELFIERDGLLRIARVDDGRMRDLRILRDEARPLEGDIWAGIIKNVSRAQQSVFIDIGAQQNAYLNLGRGRKPEDYRVGDVIAVEIQRAGYGRKGAKVTDEISLSQGPLVVMAGKGYGFSRNTDPQAFYALHPEVPGEPGVRVIFRSASLEMDHAALKAHLTELAATFRSIREAAAQAREPRRLYRDTAFLNDLVADLNGELLLVHSNDEAMSGILRAMGQREITQYPPAFHLFHSHGLEATVERLRLKQLPLAGGGSLVIEETEALVVIDVNSGSRGGPGRSLSPLELNEAALILALDEVRLRNLAGIILIDFVTMPRASDRQILFEKARELTATMRPLTKVYPLTELGLMQIARRRQGESVTSLLFSREDRKKIPVSTTYLYKLIRIRLDDPGWAMDRFDIAVNPVYAREVPVLAELVAADYPHLAIAIKLRPDVETVKVLPVIGRLPDRDTPEGTGGPATGADERATGLTDDITTGIAATDNRGGRT